MARINKQTESEIRAFIAMIMLHGDAEMDLWCYRDAEYNMINWEKDGVEMPEGMTPYYLMKFWNEEFHKRNDE